MREINFSRENIEEMWGEVKEMFREDFREASRRVIKLALEEAMRDEVGSYLAAGPNERVVERRGYRNGYRMRWLTTAVGRVELEVPRTRERGYVPGVFERYKRVEGVVNGGIKEMFLRGVSTRKVREVLDVLCGCGVSAAYVSMVTKELDEEVRRFENGPIEDEYAFLFVDALSVRIRYELRAQRRWVLVAYGIRGDGSRKLLSFRVARTEGAGMWRSFLENLKVRGLKGRKLKLIVLDGSLGLWSAVEEVYPLVPHQLCWVHKLRNIARYGPRSQMSACVSEATRIMNAGTSAQAAKLFRRWKERWQSINPRGVACLERDFARLIPFFEFSPTFHRIIRTTNVIERSFKEIRRRLKVMGYFQNTKSCMRIILSQFYYFNAKWEHKGERITAIAEYLNRAA